MKKYGLIGKSLSYSYSKLIHEYLIDKYKLDASYDLIQVNHINRELLEKYDGCNITIPYKEEVLQYIDDDQTGFNACNCLVNRESSLVGYNTDINGFDYLVNKVGAKDIKSIVVLGSGGSSKMVQYYFKDKKVIVVSRSSKKYNYENIHKIKADLLVNTTPVGMNEDKSILDKKYLSNYKYIIDLNYNPLNSRIMLDSKELSIPCINGLDMLIVQALVAFKRWNGIDYDDSLIEEIRSMILLKTSDKIALIGMPLAGKSSMIYKYNGIDLDSEIFNTYNQEIEDLLKDNSFRKLESLELERLVKEGCSLLSLGGGAILNHRNIECIKDYLIVFLNTDLTILKSRYQEGIRPLLKTINDLEVLYQKRIPMYCRYANIILDEKECEDFLNKWESKGDL